MGISGYVLKNRQKYSVEEMMGNIMIAVFKADLSISFGNNIYKNEDGSFKYTTLNIADDFLSDIEQREEFVFYIEEIKERYIDDGMFDWVSKGEQLYQVAYIEHIGDNEKIVFKFIHEYLKRNPNDYFWVEDEWVYRLEDMEHLSKETFDYNWCYKKPN